MSVVIGIDIDHGYFAALCGKEARGFSAYALRGAGDQRDASGKFGIVGHELTCAFRDCRISG